MQKKQLYKSLKIKQNLLDEILCKELSIPKEKLFLLDEIDDKYVKNIKKSLQKLQKWVPLEYILEKANFYGLDFFVDKWVLIPRNDTEIMVKEAVRESQNYKDVTLIDVGTWSGNIAISCLLNSKNFREAFLIDKSKKALRIADINVKKYDLEDKVTFLKANLLSSLPLKKVWETMIITANLPYIKNNDFKNMSPETLKYEPKMALFWGEKTGFELYEKLIKQILKLKIRAVLFIEIGFDQYEYSRKYLENLGLKYEYFKDNGSIYRCMKISF